VPPHYIAIQAGIFTVTPNPHFGLKTCRKYEIILWLEFPTCHKVHLAYLVFLSLASPTCLSELRLDLWTVFYFPMLTFIFSMLFSCPVISFMIPNDLPLFLQNIIPPLLHWLFSFTEMEEMSNLPSCPTSSTLYIYEINFYLPYESKRCSNIS
jgi:hypothetical protein